MVLLISTSMFSTGTLSGGSLAMCVERFKRRHNIEPEIPIVRIEDKGHLAIRNEYKDFFFTKLLIVLVFIKQKI